MSTLPAGPAITSGAVTSAGSSIAVPAIGQGSTSFGSGAMQSAAFNAGSGLLGGIISAIGTGVANKKAYKRYNAQMEKQWQRNLEAYGMQRADYLSDLASEREYNSPLAQVARLKAAGINPNVAFGSGSPSNTVETASNTAAIRQPNVGSIPPVNSFGQAFLQGASGLISSSVDMIQARQMETQMELQKAQAIQALSNASVLRQDAKYKSVMNGFADSFFQIDLEQKQQSLRETIARTAQIAATTCKTQNEADYVTKQTALAQLEIDNYQVRVDNIIANTALTRAQREKALQETMTECERTLGAWYDNALKEYEVIVKGQYGADKAVRDMNFRRVFNPIMEGLNLAVKGYATFATKGMNTIFNSDFYSTSSR